MENNYTDNILKELTKLKFDLEFKFSIGIKNGKDRELLIKELSAEYTNKLWRIL